MRGGGLTDKQLADVILAVRQANGHPSIWERLATPMIALAALLGLILKLGSIGQVIEQQGIDIKDGKSAVSRLDQAVVAQDKNQAVMAEKLDRIASTVNTINGKIDGQARR